LDNEYADMSAVIRVSEMNKRKRKSELDKKYLSQYLNEIGQAIMTQEDFFLYAFSKPIKRDPEDYLRHLRIYGLQRTENGTQYTMMQEKDPKSQILSIELYLSLEKQREEENDANKMNSTIDQKYQDYFDNEEIRDKLPEITECEHIHNKAVFDCFNEALDYFRPRSLKGATMPWNKQHFPNINCSGIQETLNIISKVK
jgi:hypothetical protein